MIISFGKTEHLLHRKSVTRRDWKKQTRDTLDKAWREGRHRHKAYDRSPRSGGKQIGWITLTHQPYRETLEDMPLADLVAEGGDCQTVQEFVDKYFKGNIKLTVTVIRFHYEAITTAPVNAPVGLEQHQLTSVNSGVLESTEIDPAIPNMNFAAPGELANSPFGVADFGDPFAPPEDLYSPVSPLWAWAGKATRYALVGGIGLGTASILIWVVRNPTTAPTTVYNLGNECLQVTNPGGVVPQTKLSAMAGMVGKPASQLSKTLGQSPYCGLPATSMLSGAVLGRSLYQVEGDRQMIVSTENDKVVGFDFYPPADGNLHSTGKHHDFALHQNWSWLTGSKSNAWTVVGGLGTIALAVDGPVFAPEQGVVLEQSALAIQGQLSRLPGDCSVFSSLKLPGYAIELCGLRDRQTGAVSAGQVVGHADTLHLGLLRRSGEKWMYVPPAPELAQRLLDESIQPSQS